MRNGPLWHLEQPNLLPVSSHRESPGWFLHASSSCFLPRTSSHTSSNLHAHTNTHIHPKPWRYLCICGLQEHTDSCQSLIFSSLFENRGGLEAKLKTHGTFHLEGQPGRRGGRGLKRVEVFWNTWSVSGSSRVIAVTGKQERAYKAVCVLITEKIAHFYNLGLIFYFIIFPCSYDNILFTIFILRTGIRPCRFYVGDRGASQTKAIRKQ